MREVKERVNREEKTVEEVGAREKGGNELEARRETKTGASNSARPKTC